MLIAEDLLLLLTDDVSGRLSAPAAQVDLALAGANLVELTLMNRVDVSREGDEGRRGRIVVRDQSPTGDDVLDSALEIATAHRGRRPSAVIRPLTRNLRQVLYQRLAGRGVIRAEERRVLGLFATRSWPAQDARHEAQVRQPIVEALAGGGATGRRRPYAGRSTRWSPRSSRPPPPRRQPRRPPGRVRDSAGTRLTSGTLSSAAEAHAVPAA